MISSQPKYTPPSPDRLGGSLLETVGDQTDSNLIATQRIEAAKYGVAATSDGWSSNPKSRPIEAQLFESPTVTHLNACEDLSGTVKSDVNIAKKLGDWSDAGCGSMGLPNSTVDFMAVDGAEIGSVNLLMTGANIDGVKLEPRPWLSGGVCTPHSLDLELEDIAKLGFVEEDIAEVRRRCEVRTECELVIRHLLSIGGITANYVFFSLRRRRGLSSSFVSTSTLCFCGVSMLPKKSSTLAQHGLRRTSSCRLLLSHSRMLRRIW